MTRRVAAAAVFVLLSCLLARPLDAQSARSVPPPPQPDGTGALVGTVVSASSGQPVRGATLVLNGRAAPPSAATAGTVTAAPSSPTTRTTWSDGQGRFSFSRLPPGLYVLGATRDTFIPASYGQKKPGKVGSVIELGEGHRMELSLPMTRGSAITGRVVDEFNDPLVRARVRLLSMTTNPNGVRRMRVVNEVRTDDRGVYRFFNLAPDNYLVSATPVMSIFESTVWQMASGGDLPALDDGPGRLSLFQAIEASGSGFAIIPGPDRAIRMEQLPAEDSDAVPSYAPTYHPMSPTAARAVTLTVDGLSEAAGVDIKVLPIRTANIRGVVTGIPGSGVPVQVLLHTLDAGEEPSSLTAAVDAKGQFTLRNVAPGQYAIYAQTLPNNSSERGMPIGGSFQSVGPVARIATFDRLHGRTTLTVEGENTPEVTVSLRPGRSISGRVVRDFASGPTGPAARNPTTISITPSPVPAGLPAFNTSPQVVVDSDGRFTLPGIRPGRYFLRASGPGTVRSVMWNGIETLDFRLDVGADVDVVDVVITLTDKVSEVSGVVSDSSGKPIYESTVIAVATDSRYWTLGTRRVVTTQPAADGRYTFRGLPAGEYNLSVVQDYDIEKRLDPAWLQQISATAATVTISEGGKVGKDLRIGNR